MAIAKTVSPSYGFSTINGVGGSMGVGIGGAAMGAGGSYSNGPTGAVGATGNFNFVTQTGVNTSAPHAFELPANLSEITKTIRPHRRVYEHDLAIISGDIASNLIRNRILIETSAYITTDDARSMMIGRYIEWLDGHSCGLYMITAHEKFVMVISFEMETDMIQFGVAMRG